MAGDIAVLVARRPPHRVAWIGATRAGAARDRASRHCGRLDGVGPGAAPFTPGPWRIGLAERDITDLEPAGAVVALLVPGRTNVASDERSHCVQTDQSDGRSQQPRHDALGKAHVDLGRGWRGEERSRGRSANPTSQRASRVGRRPAALYDARHDHEHGSWARPGRGSHGTRRSACCQR